MIQPVPEPDTFQRLDGELMPFLRRHAAINQRQLNIGLRSEAGNQVKALKNKTNLFVADFGEFIV